MLTLNCLVDLENLLEAEQKLKLINLKKNPLCEWVRIFVEAVKYFGYKIHVSGSGYFPMIACWQA